MNAPPLERKLYEGAVGGNVYEMRAALKAGADVNFDNGLLLRTGLKPGTIEFLVQAGADPNLIDKYGAPILVAWTMAGRRSQESFDTLLKLGANPNVPYKQHRSILDYALSVSDYYRGDYPDEIIKSLCRATNPDEVERLKQKYSDKYHNIPHFVKLLNCQASNADIGDKNVGPGGRRRKTKKRNSSKKKTKKRK